MISFSSPEFRSDLNRALAAWTKHIHDEIPDDFHPIEEWDDPELDGELSEETVINVGLYHWEDSRPFTCREFIDLVQEFKESRFVNAVACISKTRALWRVIPINQQAHRILDSSEICPENSDHEQLLKDIQIAIKTSQELRSSIKHSHQQTPEQLDLINNWSAADSEARRLMAEAERPTTRRCRTEAQLGGRVISVHLISGFTPFALHVVSNQLDHEYFPPIISEEAFVELTFKEPISDEDLSAIVQAYIFELSASSGGEFALAPREDEIGFYEDDDDDDNATLPRLRPLVAGNGIGELTSIYNRGIGTTDNELRVLCFTKVVEFVAQTVIRRQSTELIRAKLMSSRALSPDVQFIAELEALIEDQRTFRKDREAIKLAVIQCCDASELAQASPPILKKHLISNLSSDNKTQLAGLAKFSDVLYSTRNAIAHAKANYVATGDECPPDQIGELALCAKLAAEQAIRWLQSVPESSRVI